MTKKTPRQYGLWSSPITPQGLAEDRRLEAARWDSDGRTLVWLEGRSGRGVLVAQGPGRGALKNFSSPSSPPSSLGSRQWTTRRGIVWTNFFIPASVVEVPHKSSHSSFLSGRNAGSPLSVTWGHRRNRSH